MFGSRRRLHAPQLWPQATHLACFGEKNELQAVACGSGAESLAWSVWQLWRAAVVVWRAAVRVGHEPNIPRRGYK
ncbi:hypothetical protein ACP70R_022783 [Stipagrostis hirtigluma subsp. patula]